jgi:hypothetical protein
LKDVKICIRMELAGGFFVMAESCQTVDRYSDK